MLKIASIALALLIPASFAFWAFQPEPREKFEKALKLAQECTVTEDCTVLYTECPLGCYHSVARDALSELNLLADKLIEEHRSGERACAYDCDVAPPLACQAGQCAFIEHETN